MLPALADIEAAADVIYAAMPPTPQYRWPLLEAHTGVETWVKHENHTPVGAFKIRGGLVHLDRLARETTAGGAPVRGIATATRGNHGQSIGFAARRHGIPVLVVVPHGNAREKNLAMQALGVELVEAGDDFQAAVEAADALARERGWYRLPSFHPDLVAGVSTYALELFRATAAAGAELDTVYVPIGLGSGACGMLAAKAATGARADVVGVVSAHAPAYGRSLASGRLESHPATTELADGMACRTPVPEALAMLSGEGGGPALTRVVEVADAEVAAAMRLLFETTHNVAEGAGAAGLAALMQERERAPELVRGRRVAVVLSGGNVDAQLFARVLGGAAAHE